jgi:hypothetical protein
VLVECTNIKSFITRKGELSKNTIRSQKQGLKDIQGAWFAKNGQK